MSEARMHPCPVCGGSGRVARSGLVLLAMWLVWVCIGPLLPDVIDGALSTTLIVSALWIWSGQPSRKQRLIDGRADVADA